MAVDYSQYVRQAGTGLNTSKFEAGVDSFMKNRKEAIIGKANELSQNTRNMHVMPWENFSNTDVADWDISTLPTMSAFDALETYKQSAKAKGQKVYNELQKQGAFQADKFINDYNAIKKNYVSKIEQKLEGYQMVNRLSDKKMNKFIKDKGLRNLLINHASNEGTMRDIAAGERTWKEWAEDKGGALGLTAKGGGLGVLGTAGYMTGKSLYGRLRDGSTVTPAQSKIMEDALGKSEFGKKRLAKENLQIGQDISSAKGGVTRATKKLESSEKLLEQAKEKFKQSGAKGKFKADPKLAKQIAENKAALSKAKSSLSAAEKVTPKGLKPLVDKVVKKHGKAKVIKLLAKKLGVRGAMSMAAKLGLGFSGIGAPISAGLLVADVIAIRAILKDLAE